ncbi:hypothetical protein [Phormidesmis sp. 146-33]
MHPITTWLLSALGVLLIAPTPINAATIRQNFELTVNRVTPPSLESPDPALNNLPLPEIGTQGRGSFTYDESKLTFVKELSVYRDTYALGVPGRIDFADFSLDFFNRTYTQWTSGQSRIGQYLLFNRTPSGQYTPQSLLLDAVKDGTTVGILDSFIAYYPASPFVYSPSVMGSASGTFRFTDAEPVPEPSFAIVPVLVLGLGWLSQRKHTHFTKRMG